MPRLRAIEEERQRQGRCALPEQRGVGGGQRESWDGGGRESWLAVALRTAPSAALESWLTRGWVCASVRVCFGGATEYLASLPRRGSDRLQTKRQREDEERELERRQRELKLEEERQAMARRARQRELEEARRQEEEARRQYVPCGWFHRRPGLFSVLTAVPTFGVYRQEREQEQAELRALEASFASSLREWRRTHFVRAHGRRLAQRLQTFLS